MYELLILGSLSTRDMSGYKLRQVLENALVPRRKVSNGVMYPQLKKLAAAGDIVFLNTEVDARGKRLAHITPQGRQHLQELLAMPVAMDAKRESVYRFKFKVMADASLAVQAQIINEYKAAVLEDLASYQQVTLHLQRKLDGEADEAAETIEWSIRTLDLQITTSEAKVKWSNQQLASIEAAGMNGGKQANE
ncbi:PadR family transcriptional regulator [Levilactobacillus tangyuanensis]|uniref:PadR family transcriptional regulator n=1 Tax=Levilactobacillus tangyuanensis TaxID=2486021 RepID=A0ABW1TRB8_9LACO|nr:PadR family transcriptional regulator [Levilactobacillus tangyuanensis]